MKRTSPKFQGIIPVELLDALKQNKCVLFAGAGLSAQVKRSDGRNLPSWSNLLLEMLNWATEKQMQFWGDPKDIEDMINKGNLLMAAQELQDRVETAGIGEFLASVFGENSAVPSEGHRLLPHIPFRGILTTNYDSLIEGAYAVEKKGLIPSVFTHEDLLSRTSPLRREDFFIFKLHGHIDRPSTIILSSRDYQELLYGSPAYRRFLETIFSVYTIIFVGFGANDPDLDNVIEGLASIYSRTLDKHYILLPAGRMNPTEKRRLSADKRLVVIEYLEDKNHTQVVEFLRELITQLGRESEELEPYKQIQPEQLRIFISGSLKDRKNILKISHFLKERGFSVWLVHERIPSGAKVSQQISSAIKEADAMIVVLSKSSVSSSWVQLELGAALQREKFICPIIIGDVTPPAYLMNMIYLKLKERFQSKDLEPLYESLSKIKLRRSAT